MRSRSYHSVGLTQILEAVRVPKGSFYHYFESKEEFGVELLRGYIQRESELRRKLLLCGTIELSPRARLFTMLEATIARFQEVDGHCPCLALKLASEVADLSEGMRAVLAEAMGEWVCILEQVLEEARTAQEIPEWIVPREGAEMVRDLFAGAVQRGALLKSTEPLRAALRHIHLVLMPRPESSPQPPDSDRSV